MDEHTGDSHSPTASEQADGQSSVDRRTMGLIGVSVLLLVVCIWLAISLSGARKTMTARVAEERSKSAQALEASKAEAARRAAEAFAASLDPLMSLKGQAPEITDRTLQQTCASLVGGGGYSLVQIVDQRGVVIASSDLARIGLRLEEGGSAPASAERVEGGVRAVAPVGPADARAGTVVLILRD